MKSGLGVLLLATFAIGLVSCGVDSSGTFAPGTQTNWLNSATTTECWRRDGNTILRQECAVSDKTILTILGRENNQVIVRIDDGPYAALVNDDDFSYFVGRTRYLKERDQLVLRHLPN